MVQPHKDLFCFTPGSWDLAIDWRKIWIHLAFKTMVRGFGPVQHLAVEFDPSWNFDWPAEFYKLHDEISPRGFVSRLITEVLSDRMHCFLWLIDRSTPTPQASSQTTSTRVFYDLETEYVETERVDIAWDAKGEDMKNSAFFINELAKSGEELYTMNGDPALPGSPREWVFDIDEYLGILTSRDLKQSIP